MELRKRTQVKESSLEGAGQGLYATEFIKAGESIIEYTGKVIGYQKAKRLKNRSYLKAVSFNKHIDGNCDQASDAKFINDNIDSSCHNVTFSKLKENNETKIIVKALRNIEKGEELFVDYGRGFWLFQNQPSFLGVKVQPDGLFSNRDLPCLEVISVLASVLIDETLHPIGRNIEISKREEVANCILKVNPFVVNTVMISSIRDISSGEKIVAKVPDKDSKVSILLDSFKLKLTNKENTDLYSFYVE